LTNFYNPKIWIGTQPILGFSIGENGQGPGIHDLGIAVTNTEYKYGCQISMLT